MELGNFSVSLTVQNLEASRQFYEKFGWDSNAQKLEGFTDVREIQRELKAQGVTLMNEADESTTGPASFMALDPDGNPILVEQHV